MSKPLLLLFLFLPATIFYSCQSLFVSPLLPFLSTSPSLSLFSLSVCLLWRSSLSPTSSSLSLPFLWLYVHCEGLPSIIMYTGACKSISASKTQLYFYSSFGGIGGFQYVKLMYMYMVPYCSLVFSWCAPDSTSFVTVGTVYFPNAAEYTQKKEKWPWLSLTLASYGYLTWEWKVGIRSYAYPLLFATVYKVLEILGLDNRLLLVKYLYIFLALVGVVCTNIVYGSVCLCQIEFCHGLDVQSMVELEEASLDVMYMIMYSWHLSNISQHLSFSKTFFVLMTPQALLFLSMQHI